MYREYCAQSWFHLQDYVEMHGQQNVKKIHNFLLKIQDFRTEISHALEVGFTISVSPISFSFSKPFLHVYT
jgi:hypothetical protein